MDAIAGDAASTGTGGVVTSVVQPVDLLFRQPRHDPVGDPESRPESRAARPVALSPAPVLRLVLGPLRIARIVLGGDIPADEGMTGLLLIPDDRRLMLHDGTAIDVRAGDLIALPAGGLLRSIGQRPLACTAVLGSRRFLGPALPSRSAVVVLPRSGSVDALRRHVERLYSIGAGALDAAQALAAASSIRELLAAAAVPVAPVRQRGVQREEALLDRILEHVDATLGSDLSIPLLCEALACSRSALYRAAAPRGGLVKIVMQQRLLAVHSALRRPGDRRSIAEIARAHGFTDASQFSRCFRRTFGVSAGRVRSGSVHGAADGVLCHPDTARLFALTGAGMDGGAEARD